MQIQAQTVRITDPDRQDQTIEVRRDEAGSVMLRIVDLEGFTGQYAARIDAGKVGDQTRGWISELELCNHLARRFRMANGHSAKLQKLFRLGLTALDKARVNAEMRTPERIAAARNTASASLEALAKRLVGPEGEDSSLGSSENTLVRDALLQARNLFQVSGDDPLASAVNAAYGRFINVHSSVTLTGRQTIDVYINPLKMLIDETVRAFSARDVILGQRLDTAPAGG